MNSLNHYSYGSVVEWIYRDVAGINPIEEHPGFRRFSLAPKPHWLLGSAAAEFDSPVGRISSAWEIAASGELSFRFAVPFGAVAALTLPDCPTEYPRELTAGKYAFRYMPTCPVRPIMNLDTPINEVLANENTSRVLGEELPELTAMMLFPMLAGAKSVSDFIRDGYLSLTPVEKQALEAKLQAAATT
jgi:alpha-L-rhamnosidase